MKIHSIGTLSVETTTRQNRCQDIRQTRQTLFMPPSEDRSESWFRSGGILGRINKLPNFRALLVEIGEVLFAEPLINLKLLLGAVIFTGANVSLAETVVRVGKIGIELKGPDILRDGLGIIILLG